MSNWSESKIQAVWEKATPVQNNNPDVWRKDVCGAWINRPKYGEETTYGWEIDHVNPTSNGGSDQVSNLQPLQWRNNRNKGESLSSNYCCVTANGTSNKDTCG